jgi:hypothetical protein
MSVDVWEQKIIDSIPDNHLVAWEDHEAYSRYKKYNQVYDKLYLGRMVSGIKTWDLETQMPDKWPVVVKPRVSIAGMSNNMYMACEEREIYDTKGMIAQERIDGHHYTTDYLMLDGMVVDEYTFVAKKNWYDSFLLFESMPMMFPNVALTVMETLPDYTGPVCVEHINEKIIDFHLRPALQFYDICNGLHDRIVPLMKKLVKQQTKFIKTYSLVYRVPFNCYVILPKKLPLKPAGVSSYTFTTIPGEKLGHEDLSNDKFSYRYMYVNGTNYTACLNYGNSIKNSIRFVK